MAIERHNTLELTPQMPPCLCRTAADVRNRTAQVQAFRGRVWPLQRPTAPPPPPPPALKKAPVLLVQMDEMEPAVPGRISVRRVLDATAEHFGLTVEALLSDTRKHPLVRRRQIAMFLACRLTGRSLPFVGRVMGGFDHTTILHGKRAIEALLDAGDAATMEAVNAITAQLTGGAHG
jgi:Bacterial dnaA protein helix-turn-helix